MTHTSGRIAACAEFHTVVAVQHNVGRVTHVLKGTPVHNQRKRGAAEVTARGEWWHHAERAA